MFVVLLLVDLSNFYYSFISARNESLARACFYLTVTDFARFLGMSGSHFLSIAM
jgi:hypothetical protein